jgi:hypothetical protein
MARLFVANLGRQAHEFHYRVPATEGFSRQTNMRKIKPGEQEQIYNEAPLSVIEAIIDQHRQYGIIEASEVAKVKDFVGLCFSIDHPVNLDQMHYGVDHNSGVLFDVGTKNREEAAVAFDRIVNHNLAEAQQRGELRGSATLNAVSVENLEDGDTPKFGEGIRVDHLNTIEGGRRRA